MKYEKWFCLAQKSTFPLSTLFKQSLFDTVIRSSSARGVPSWPLTRLPPGGSSELLADRPAPHIWREKMSGIPSCCTTELKKGSTDESGWSREENMKPLHFGLWAFPFFKAVWCDLSRPLTLSTSATQAYFANFTIKISWKWGMEMLNVNFFSIFYIWITIQLRMCTHVGQVGSEGRSLRLSTGFHVSVVSSCPEWQTALRRIQPEHWRHQQHRVVSVSVSAPPSLAFDPKGCRSQPRMKGRIVPVYTDVILVQTALNYHVKEIGCWEEESGFCSAVAFHTHKDCSSISPENGNWFTDRILLERKQGYKPIRDIRARKMKLNWKRY